MNKSNLILASVSAIIFTSILIIFSPTSKKTFPSSPTPNPMTTNIPQIETEKSEIKNESEIISLDGTWNLYKNYQLGFLIKFPKIALNSWANCREENGQFLNQEGPLPITVYESQEYVHIAPKYFYDPTEENKEGIIFNSNCIKTNITADLIEERIVSSSYTYLPSSIWSIKVKDINNEQELDQFVKSSYFSGCTYTLKESTHDALDVQINSDIGEPTPKCPINFVHVFKYFPKYHKAVTWSIGHEATFQNGSDVLDGEMIESFTFFK